MQTQRWSKFDSWCLLEPFKADQILEVWFINEVFIGTPRVVLVDCNFLSCRIYSVDIEHQILMGWNLVTIHQVYQPEDLHCQ